MPGLQPRHGGKVRPPAVRDFLETVWQRNERLINSHPTAGVDHQHDGRESGGQAGFLAVGTEPRYRARPSGMETTAMTDGKLLRYKPAEIICWSGGAPEVRCVTGKELAAALGSKDLDHREELLEELAEAHEAMAAPMDDYANG